jgi:hypothetical protein
MEQRIIDRSYVGEVLQQIYTSELDIRLTLFSEGGYFYIGHYDRKSPLRGTTIEEAVTNLALRVAKEFPTSRFASWWATNFTPPEN